MASNIKGITVEIGGDTTKLDKALKNVNTSSRSLQSELTKVNKALKLDHTNVTLIKQKQDILRESIEKTKEKLETLKNVQQQVEQQFNSGQIGADQYRAFQREIENTQQRLNSLNQEARNFGTNVSPNLIAAREHLASFGEKATEIGQKMLPITAGITAIGAGAVKFASDFQSGMSQVAATMGYTTEQLHNSSSQEAQDFERLKDAAKEMGATTQFSATEASEALNYLALAGYDVDKSISTLPDVLNLAAAGGMELGTACDMVTDASSALNLTTEQTTTLIDQMAKTSQKSNTNVAQLGEAILTVGGTANSLSGGITEMNTALGVLANVGYKGAEGGTHLRNVILSLSAASPGVTDMLKSMGVETLDAYGNMKPLNEILTDLNRGMATLGSGEKAQILYSIFNKTDLAAVSGLMSSVTGSTLELSDVLTALDYNVEEHGRTWNDLKNYYDDTLDSEEMVTFYMDNFGMTADQATAACATLKSELGDTANTWNNLENEVQNNALGSAAAQAQTMMDNLKGKITLLKSAVEGLGIQIGDILLPFIEALTEKINGLITWLSNLNPTTQKIIVLIAAIVAAVGPVLIIIGKIATGISALIGAFIKIKEVILGLTIVQNGLNLSFLACPLTWLVLVITAAVAAFIYFWNTSEGFRNFWINLWNTVKSVAGSVFNWLSNFFTQTLPNAFNTVIDFIKSNWQGLLLLLVNPFVGAFKLLYDNCNQFREFINNLVEGIKNIFSSIGEFFSSLWDGVVSIFNEAVQGIQNAWSGITEFFSSLWNSIVENVSTFITNLISSFSGTIDGINQIFNGWIEVLNGIWEVIKNVFMGAVLIICDLVTGDFTQLGTDLEGIWNNITSALSGIWDGICSVAQGIWNTICNYITELCTNLINGLQNIWQSFSSFISSLWQNIYTLASTVWNSICTAITNVCTILQTTITTIWNNIVTTVTNVMNSIFTTVSNIWNNISSTISSIINNFPSMAQSAFNNMCSAISSALTSIPGIIQNGFQSGISYIKGLASQAIGWGRDFVNGLKTGIMNGLSSLKESVVETANTIRSYLHFSVPDVGPLTDYESWMPDFMEGLSKGIEKSKNKVIDSVKGLATDMKVNLNTNAYIPSFATGSNSNSIQSESPKSDLILQIENFNNNRNTDIKQLMQEAEFYRKTH